MSKITFEIPEGTQPSKCRGCGAEVYWIITAAGKRMPADPDGQSHFATCPEASRFRKDRPVRDS
jgi:hypothetical protein